MVCDDPRSATLDAGNVKLTYNALIEKVNVCVCVCVCVCVERERVAVKVIVVVVFLIFFILIFFFNSSLWLLFLNGMAVLILSS